MVTDVDSDVVTSAEAVKLLQVSHSTLAAMIKRGDLKPLPSSPALIRPKRHYFRRSDIERILREGRKPAADA